MCARSKRARVTASATGCINPIGVSDVEDDFLGNVHETLHDIGKLKSIGVELLDGRNAEEIVVSAFETGRK